MEPPDLKPDMEEPEGEVEVDDLPWRSRGTGLDVGEQDADECLRWMGSKVLEHAGFQSESTLSESRASLNTKRLHRYLESCPRRIYGCCYRISI